jgi:hypothetical protein
MTPQQLFDGLMQEFYAGKFKEGIKLWKANALDLNTLDQNSRFDFWHVLAMLYFYAKDYPEAEKYSKALVKSPDIAKNKDLVERAFVYLVNSTEQQHKLDNKTINLYLTGYTYLGGTTHEYIDYLQAARETAAAPVDRKLNNVLMALILSYTFITLLTAIIRHWYYLLPVSAILLAYPAYDLLGKGKLKKWRMSLIIKVIDRQMVSKWKKWVEKVD